jgi:arylsulfatase A-like enzyme
MVSDDYHCGYYGKWHLGDEVVPQHGFEDWVSIEDNYRQYYSKKEYLSRLSDHCRYLLANGFEPNAQKEGARVFSRPVAARLPERFTKAAFLGRESARFIRENQDRPFVLYVNFLEPHSPFTGPLDDLYPPDEILVGPHFLQKPPEDAPLPHRMLADHYTQQSDYEGLDLRTEAGWRKLRAQYLGLVTLVDRAVGEILSALDESGQADNTIVVFTSDHGDMMGDHGIVAKCVLYEEAVKVPLLVRVPWLGREHRIVEGRVSQIDLVPTLLDLMDEPVPEGLQGESRASTLRGEATLEDNDAFIEWIGHNGRFPSGNRPGFPPDPSDERVNRLLGLPWRTVVSAEGWKLNLSPEDRCELFNLNADPVEQVNLFDDSAQRDRVRDLTERIRRWQQHTEDNVPLPSV